MEEPYQRNTRSDREGFPKGRTSWPWAVPGKLGDYTWSPMAWIFLGLFALAEVGNWQMGNEIRRVCELFRQGDVSIAMPDLATEEIEAICRKRSPQN